EYLGPGLPAGYRLAHGDNFGDVEVTDELRIAGAGEDDDPQVLISGTAFECLEQFAASGATEKTTRRAVAYDLSLTAALCRNVRHEQLISVKRCAHPREMDGDDHRDAEPDPA